jgi:hypothetical protein
LQLHLVVDLVDQTELLEGQAVQVEVVADLLAQSLHLVDLGPLGKATMVVQPMDLPQHTDREEVVAQAQWEPMVLRQLVVQVAQVLHQL